MRCGLCRRSGRSVRTLWCSCQSEPRLVPGKGRSLPDGCLAFAPIYGQAPGIRRERAPRTPPRILDFDFRLATAVSATIADQEIKNPANAGAFSKLERGGRVCACLG